MLYLHGGWPRTSTTSLQTALFKHKEGLAATGLDYPDRWGSNVGLTHHGLSELLAASFDSRHPMEEFKRFLSARADRSVLFSAEVLAYWVSRQRRLAAFLGLLTAAQEVMPTRCVWTLRRIDDFFNSLVLLRAKSGNRPRAPVQLGGRTGEESGELDHLFLGYQEVERIVGGNVVYVKYDPAGTHNRQLLAAFDISGPMAAEIEQDLQQGPRLHASPTHKQAVVLTNLSELSLRAGVELEASAVREAFEWDGFSFQTDRACSIAGAKKRRDLHQQALSAARRHGVTSYVEFFEGAEIDPAPPCDLRAKVITDGDLERLVAHLDSRRSSPHCSRHC